MTKLLTPPHEWTPAEKANALRRMLDAEKRLLDPATPAFIREIALPRIRQHITTLCAPSHDLN